MMKFLKWLVITVVALVVILVGAVFTAPYWAPTGVIAEKVVAAAKSATGRDLKIAGPIRLAVLPSPGIEASDVSFANAAGGSAKEMAQFKTLAVRLALLPLFKGEIAVDRFELVDPVIALEVDAQGKPNWVFAAKAPATPQAPPAAGAPKAPPAPAGGGGGFLPAGLSLEDVRLVNGKISYLDRRTNKSQVLEQLNMKVSLPSLAGPFAAEGTARWNGEDVKLDLGVAKPQALQQGGGSPITLKLASKPVTFDFAGDASDAGFAHLAGTIALAMGSVRDFAKWAGTPIAGTGTTLGPLSIKGKIDVGPAKYAFSDAELAIDAIKAKGAITVDTASAPLELQGRLDVDRLDVNPYLGAAGTPAGGGAKSAAGAPTAPAAAAPSPSGWSEAPIDLSPLKLVNADFALSAQSVQYQKIALGKTALAIHVKGGTLTTDLTDIEAYQGKGQGKVVLDGATQPAALSANFNFANVAVGPLLRDAASLDVLTGTGNVEAALAGKGANEKDLIQSLGGKGSIRLAKGTIQGIDLPSLLKGAMSGLKNIAGGTGQTQVTDLSGTWTMSQGVLHNGDLQFKSAEITATGAGTVDLPHRTVDYRLSPKIANALGIPILIKGPWTKPAIEPDLAAIATSPAAALGGLTGGSVPKQIPGALKGLLGR